MANSCFSLLLTHSNSIILTVVIASFFIFFFLDLFLTNKLWKTQRQAFFVSYIYDQNTKTTRCGNINTWLLFFFFFFWILSRWTNISVCEQPFLQRSEDPTWFFWSSRHLSILLLRLLLMFVRCVTCTLAPSWFIIQLLRPDAAALSMTGQPGLWRRNYLDIFICWPSSCQFCSLHPVCCKRLMLWRKHTLCCFANHQVMERRKSCGGQEDKKFCRAEDVIYIYFLQSFMWDTMFIVWFTPGCVTSQFWRKCCESEITPELYGWLGSTCVNPTIFMKWWFSLVTCKLSWMSDLLIYFTYDKTSTNKSYFCMKLLQTYHDT